MTVPYEALIVASALLIRSLVGLSGYSGPSCSHTTVPRAAHPGDVPLDRIAAAAPLRDPRVPFLPPQGGSKLLCGSNYFRKPSTVIN